MTSATTAEASTRPAVGRRTPLWPVGLAAAVAGAIAAVTLSTQGTDAEGLQLLNRGLARFAFLIFLPIYCASPLLTLAPGAVPRWLVRHRRSLGLAYALVMACHLVAILALYATPKFTFGLDLEVVGGGLGLLLIGALAATSSDAAVRRLGTRAWKRLHATTLHFLWVIYAFTYVGRVTEWSPAYWPGLATVVALPCLRLAARRRRR
ncbi:MAG: hypothetical protein MJE66_05255 [Proteobacteria bacterium]|nr:hypothetical protein [Pseudomonadota bacterium]